MPVLAVCAVEHQAFLRASATPLLRVQARCLSVPLPNSSRNSSTSRPYFPLKHRRKDQGTSLSEFIAYLRLGFGHIADPKAYDHMLFIAALTAAYPPSAWKRLVWLVTAFTLGHSVTLALATLDVVRVNIQLVEVLIPITIVLTSLTGIVTARGAHEMGSPRVQYTLAAVFGLIHGLGFSSFLRSLLGGEESIVGPLFAFNVGLEVGQLFIVAGVMLLGLVAERLLRLTRREWVLVLCGGTMAVAITMIVDRIHPIT